MTQDRKPTVAEVAERAGVSTATVDRVMNGRGGVAPHTVARVEDAMRSIVQSGQPAMVDDISPCHALLAADGSAFMDALTSELRATFENAGVSFEVTFVDRQDPAVIVSGIAKCVAAGCKSLVIQAVDTAAVRSAIDEAAASGVTVVTVTTDVPNSRRHAYVGLDNRAAGRTAGFLMGRFCHGPGTLAIVWGGHLYRSHEERESGFRSVLRTERPDLKCLEVITGDYTPSLACQLTADVMARHPDLVGIYCIGGGLSGVANAVDQAGRPARLVLIGHNFNSDTQDHLLSGTISAIIHQDVQHVAENVLAALLQRPSATLRTAIRTEIITRENFI